MSVEPATERRNPRPSLATAARDLVVQARRGILNTLTAEDGYPYGSLVELLPLPDGDLVVYLSRLAEHQHYVERDSRASVTIVPHLLENDAMAKPRVTLVGNAEVVADRDLYGAQYVALHPDVAAYLSFPDFQFYRLRVARVRYIAGFGQMGWIRGDVYREAFRQP